MSSKEDTKVRYIDILFIKYESKSQVHFYPALRKENASQEITNRKFILGTNPRETKQGIGNRT